MLQPVIASTESLKVELVNRVELASQSARTRNRPVVASHTFSISPDIDVAACVFASRGAEERYFVWEQRNRDGFALGAIGSAHTIDRGPSSNRFRRAAQQINETMQDAIFDDVGIDGDAPPASGPVWVGGFSFVPDGGSAPQWRSLRPTLLTLPLISIARQDESARVTVNVLVRPDDDPSELARWADARVAALRSEPLPLRDPDPVRRYKIESETPPETYEQCVTKSVRLVNEGDLEKVVMAREVKVEGPDPFHPATVFEGLRSSYPSCYCFCIGTPNAAFLGASPELLVRREGARLSSVAMAGSTRRSADPKVDEHLGEHLRKSVKDRVEHDIVVQGIKRSLQPLSVWVSVAEEPVLIKVENIQHLATPIRAQLTEPISVLDLAGALHPTSAVGGEPWPRAKGVIEELEPFDRGWYAGPIGWVDAIEDGEFCVALRCALLQGRSAYCYAGVGVVGDSNPEAELAESEVKLQALLSVLTGS